MLNNDVYKETKLKIFESAHNGEITESVRDKMLIALEAKKDEDKISADDAIDYLKTLTDSFPDLEEDIESLMDKLKDSNKKDNKEEKDEKSDDDSNDDSDDEDIKESFDDLFSILEDL